jgi:hypothetical protein
MLALMEDLEIVGILRRDILHRVAPSRCVSIDRALNG